MAVQRLVELQIAPPDISTLGRIDQETVKFLNHFGGTPLPLFGVSPTSENRKTTIILEGIAPEVGKIHCQLFSVLMVKKLPLTSNMQGHQSKQSMLASMWSHILPRSKPLWSRALR